MASLVYVTSSIVLGLCCAAVLLQWTHLPSRADMITWYKRRLALNSLKAERDDSIYSTSHLQLPSNVFPSEKDRIPYRSVKGYDRGEFMDYPNRVGWPQALRTSDPLSFASHDIVKPAGDHAMEDFLQTWLFFGLLHELLGPAYDEMRYLARDKKGIAVHTRHLKNDMEDWSRRAAEFTVEQSGKEYARLARCLTLTFNVLAITASVISVRRQKPLLFNRAIRQSIAILGETISQTVGNVLNGSDESEVPLSWSMHYADDEMLTTMKHNGWCHSDAEIARKTFALSAVSLHFIERMNKLDPSRNHEACDRVQCSHLTIDNAKYRTRHVDTGCRDPCNGITVGLTQLGAVLDSGAIPLLRLTLDPTDPNNVTISVEASGKDKAYVALSHVWADGLGNTIGNDLPHCQIIRLAGLVNSLHGRIPFKSKDPENRDLLFWCDTLCVPVKHGTNQAQNRWRNLAMKRMRQVYERSSYTLVLDRSLEGYSVSEIGMTEAAFRIITSPWTRRLWTFQEGVLPETVLFQFRDTAVDIRDIWARYKPIIASDSTLSMMRRSIVGWCLTMREPFHSARPLTLNLNDRRLIEAIGRRGVSVKSDEPLCLGTILNLDMSKIVSTNPEARMDAFWKAMHKAPGGIPQNIIFNCFPRLHSDGLRWAPSTFLAGSEGLEHLLSMSDDNGDVTKGTLTEHGLLVKLPAMIIQRMHVSEHLVVAGEIRPFGVNEDVHLRRDDGSWFNISVDTNLGAFTKRDVVELINSREAVLLTKKERTTVDFGYGGQFALLAEQVRPQSVEDQVRHSLSGSPPVLRSMAQLTVSRLRPPSQHVWSRAYDVAQRFQEAVVPAPSQPFTALTDTDKNAALHELKSQITWKLLLASKRECEQDAELVENIRLMTGGNGQPDQLFRTRVLIIFVGHYANVRRELAPDSEWYVD